MKLLYLFLLILPLPFVFANAVDPIDKTAGLIQQGDIHALSKDFSPTVELTIMGEGDVYSSAEAETKLNDFFTQHPPKSVKILHRICSNPNFRFGVLILTTNNGVYRTSFSLKSTNGRFELNELRIESQKTK